MHDSMGNVYGCRLSQKSTLQNHIYRNNFTEFSAFLATSSDDLPKSSAHLAISSDDLAKLSAHLAIIYHRMN